MPPTTIVDVVNFFHADLSKISEKEIIDILQKTAIDSDQILLFHPNMNAPREAEAIELRALTHEEDIVEGVYQCGKCGSKKVVTRSAQLRSADEPMTILNRCYACGNKWKMH